jgi:hypothetical protein
MPLNIQAAPQAPSYDAASIQVPANIATPQATMEGVKAQQSQLNAVNTLSGGRGGGRGRSRSRRLGRKSFIRTYKGRRYIPKQQTGGSSSSQSGGQIVIPQVGSTCSSGPQCAGAQNANLTATHNQALSNSINDAYAEQKGGRKKVRFTMNRRSHRRKPRHDQSLTSMIAYNIKKVMRKVFS